MGSRHNPPVRAAVPAATAPCGYGVPGPAVTRPPLAAAATWSRWLVAGTAVAAGGPAAGLPAVPAPVVLAVAGLGLVAGVPHGAADHVIATRLAGGMPTAPVAAVYAGATAGVWALLRWAGPAALIAVVALSALHFGLGELEVARRLTGWQPPVPVACAIVVAGSGALVLPLARCGDQMSAVATAVSPGLARALAWAPVHTGLAVTWLVAALVAVAAALRSAHPGTALDILIPGAAGMLAPPLLAFGMWFGGWHSLRHGARMLAVEPGCAALLAAGRRRAAALRLIRIAAMPSLAALTALAALGWLTAAAPNPNAVLADVLRLLLALTVPHALVVLWADRSTRDFTPPRRPSPTPSDPHSEGHTR